ncbi:MAG: DUF5615 family PIN-like protein [Acidobacteriota bacterium]
MTFPLYFDEDSQDQNLVRALRARGVGVVTAVEAGMLECGDETQLDWASAHGRVLYSFNVADFYRVHGDYLREGKSHSGIILARQQRYSVGEQMRRLLKLLALRSAEDMRNQVEFLSAMG